MSDDSETVEDTEKGSLAEVTDDSCTVEFIEIVPLDRASNDYHKLEFIEPVVEVKPEDLLDVKQEPADESGNEDPEDLLDMKLKLQFIDPVVEVKPEDLQEIKQEPADENDNEDLNYSVKWEPSDKYETEAPCFTTEVSTVIFS